MAEAAAGALAGSLALLADAGHNLSDVLGLGLALGAATLALRPPTARHTFGYRRAEVLAALANAGLIVVIAVLVFVDAARRLGDPPEVAGGWLLAAAALGLVVNAASAALVFRRGGASLNLRAAFVHLVADAMSSLGVLVAGAVILATGWLYADPVISLLIGVLLLFMAVGIIREAVLVLLESSPAGVDTELLGERLAATPGVVEVHDLHVWAITSGFPALSAHVLVREGDDCHAIRRELERLLEESFGIEHTTLQVDHAGEGRVVWAGRAIRRPGPGG